MASSSGKRSRDPEEEEMYLDNFHSHKRYLSEIMATSLNGLTVGDSLTESLMESPSRDEVAAPPYSPMSEDSDEPRFICDPTHTDVGSRPTSPVSPHRHQKPLCGLLPSINSCPHPTCSLPSLVCNHPRQQRRTDSEGRFPSSPSDICHTADLRRAALLRSVQMRTQPQGNMQNLNLEEGEEHRTYLCVKASNEEVGGYQSLDHVSTYDEDKCFDDEFSANRN